MDDDILTFWAAPDSAMFPPPVIAKVRGGVSRALLERERWLGSGPPYIKIKGRVLYRKADILAWMEEIGVRPELLSLPRKSKAQPQHGTRTP
jgi:hypothetical protein